MEKNKKKSNKQKEQSNSKEEPDGAIPQYCMIAPTVDDVLDREDNQIACANRS